LYGVPSPARARSFGPHMRAVRECWRWGASLLLADSFAHLGATALLLGALALHVETRFGTLRTAALALVAGLGGNFFDALATARAPARPVAASHCMRHSVSLVLCVD